MQAHLMAKSSPSVEWARRGGTLMAEDPALRRFTLAQLRVSPEPSPAVAPEPECECQDTERCPVHFGYDD